VIEIKEDCDQDTLLILVRPRGPVCHTGSDTCFGQRNLPDFLGELEAVIKERKASPSANSYTCSLFEQGLARIAQKVGEEAVEVVIAAMADERTRLKEESADLLFHLLVLLREKDISWQEVLEVLKGRH
jgi:phosphoribosyl-ATP pyrophosphohydrolase/phosphoribosyl-AMP cyclohydrolase